MAAPPGSSSPSKSNKSFMPARRNNRRYLLWLALGTTFMAAAMAVLLALQVTQQRSIRKSSDLRSDSITALAFQLEREFLRLRQALELHAQSEVPKPLKELRLRSDIFASRFQVMHDTPSTTALHEQRAYMETMPRLEALVTRIDQLLGSDKAPSQKEFQQLVEEFNGLGPDVQELTMAANRHVSTLLEEQESTMLTQSGHIMVLIVAQLVILLLAAAALAWRQYRQEKERQALQQLTESLQAANAAAEEANRGKSQFLANMSHELRTPFNGVLGMLTLLERTRLDSSQREYVYTARHSADHLLSLLNDILDVSAMEAGKMSIHPVPVHLPPLLEGIEKLMRPLAQQKGLGFAMELTNDLPSWVEADGTRLRQIFLNLVTNAIKFSDAGTVAVKVGRDEKAAPDQANTYPLRLDVVDEGIGMDHATLTKLFERFAQGDASTSRRFGGTGLGLEISRNLARRMGGDIKAHSILGQGSTFTVTLPLALAAPPKLPVSLGQPRTPAASSAELAGLDILVADDQMVNRKYMGALLSSMGHVPRFAENGEQAVAEVQKKPPQLVFMDLHMPVMDGFEATRTLRQWPQYKALPIVALTADVFAQTREKATEAGMTTFIAKPVSVDTIQSLLSEMFAAPATDSTVPASSAPTIKETTSSTAPLTSQQQATAPPQAKRTARRRFKSGDVTSHIDMAMVGEVCVGVTVQGYRSLLQGYFSDESGSLDALLQAMAEGPQETLQAAAHGFKGASSNLGFSKLAALAFHLEKGEYPPEGSTREQLLDAWEMTHALCLRMGLTDVEAVQARHSKQPQDASATAG